MATKGFGELFMGDLCVYTHADKHAEAQVAAVGTSY